MNFKLTVFEFAVSDPHYQYIYILDPSGFTVCFIDISFICFVFGKTAPYILHSQYMIRQINIKCDIRDLIVFSCYGSFTPKYLLPTV